MSEMLVAKQTFLAVLDGQRVKVTKGKTRVRADHQLVKGREDLFKLADVQYDVEDTTARPGQRRGRKPAKVEAYEPPAAPEADEA